jgi:hypothetical protein
MILDAAFTVAQLKTLPFLKAERFLKLRHHPELSAAEFFERYLSTRDGMAILKTKYAANKAAIDAKFEELKAWIAPQRLAAGDTDP